MATLSKLSFCHLADQSLAEWYATVQTGIGIAFVTLSKGEGGEP
jgi:thermostable 8-oxoguanine DNA glycosylase